jgi:hypothetical protein
VLVVVEVVIVGTREELERCGSIASGGGWFMKCDIGGMIGREGRRAQDGDKDFPSSSSTTSSAPVSKN